MVKHRVPFVLLVVVVAALAGCASGVTRLDSPTASAASAATVQLTVKSVNVWLNEDAKKLLADNVKFDQTRLKSTVERTLEARNALKTDAAQMLDIEITSMRVRSNFSAVMFGFMAGSDSVEGIVSIKDEAGKVVKKVKVNASYALGGLAGGQDDARMGWLYEEFAKHTVAELTGVPAK